MSDVPISERAGVPVDARRPRPAGSWAVRTLAVGTFAVGTDAFVVAGFLPSMAADLRVSTAAAGASVSVFAVAYAVAAPVLAAVTSRVPRRTLLVVALVVLALGNLVCSLAPTLAVLLGGRVLAALGAAVYTPSAGVVAADLVRPEVRGRALATVVGGLTVATAVGVPLGDLASNWLGWRAALGGVAGLCCLVALGVALSIPRLGAGARVSLRTRLAALRRPAVLAVLPLTVLGMGASYIVYAYAVPALGGVGVAEPAVMWMLLVYGVGATFGSLASGRLTDRVGPVRVLSVAYAVMALGLAALAWSAASGWTPAYVVAVLVLVWGATTWTQTPAQQTRLMTLAPREAPILVALNASAIYLGIGAGTLLGGAVLSAAPWVIFALAAAVAVLALGYLCLTVRLSGEG